MERAEVSELFAVCLPDCVFVCVSEECSAPDGAVIRPSNLPPRIPALPCTATSNPSYLHRPTAKYSRRKPSASCALAQTLTGVFVASWSRPGFHRRLSENDGAATLIVTTLTECPLIHQRDGGAGLRERAQQRGQRQA